MATKLWAFALMFICTLLTSIAQILYKIGANRLMLDFVKIITNYHIIIGVFLYAIGGIIMIIAFKGGDVSTLYPIVATSYIWVSLLSIHFFNESMNIYKCIGILIITAGISSIGFGSKKAEILEYTEVV